MISTKKASEMLGICEITLEEWVKDKKIKCTYVGEDMYFKLEDVNSFIERTGIKLVTPDIDLQDLRKIFDVEFDDKGNKIVTDSNMNIQKLLSEQSKKNNTLNSDEIKDIINNLSKK